MQQWLEGLHFDLLTSHLSNGLRENVDVVRAVCTAFSLSSVLQFLVLLVSGASIIRSYRKRRSICRTALEMPRTVYGVHLAVFSAFAIWTVSVYFCILSSHESQEFMKAKCVVPSLLARPALWTALVGVLMAVFLPWARFMTRICGHCRLSLLQVVASGATGS